MIHLTFPGRGWKGSCPFCSLATPLICPSNFSSLFEHNQGFVFDSSHSLLQSTHIQVLQHLSLLNICALCHISNTLDHKTATIIANFLSLPPIVLKLYYFLPALHFHRLQLVQNSLTSAISRTPLYSLNTPVIRSLANN